MGTLAKDFGVSPATVRDIADRKTRRRSPGWKRKAASGYLSIALARQIRPAKWRSDVTASGRQPLN
jgi:hypothetical protein